VRIRAAGHRLTAQAIGNSISGAIWRNRMPGLLADNLAPLGLNQTTIDTIYGSAIAASAYPFGGEVRNAIVRWCDRRRALTRADRRVPGRHAVRRYGVGDSADRGSTLLIVGTVMAVPPIFIALLLHNVRAVVRARFF